MSFVSIDFLLLLVISVILYYLVPKKYRFVVLILANIYFYIKSSGWHSLYLLVSIISVYIAGILFACLEKKKENLQDLEKEKKVLLKKKIKSQKHIVLLITILLNIGVLLVLKYDNFFIDIVNNLFKTNISLYHFILPLGISYYTLEAISYIVDTYNQKYDATKNFFKLFLYLSFFPLMVEGPISRFDEIGDSLYNGHCFDYNRFVNGFLRIIWGFTKKLVVADRVGLFVDQIFQGGHSGLVVLVGVILYVIQIYAEFSGCMDIVIGSGSLFGIKLPENFKEPLFSKSIGEFWRRWHITLGSWLKDYIFYPISISKTNLKLNIASHKHLPKFFADFIASCFPLLFVWLIMGFWHGASWKYVLYGMYYFLIMVLGILLKPVFGFIINLFKIKTECFSYHLFQALRTIFFVTIGMTIFRAETFNQALSILSSIFQFSSEPISALSDGYANVILIIVFLMVIFVIDILKYFGVNILDKLNDQNLIFRYLVYLIVVIALLIFGIYGYGYNPSSFIYGGF